jgi:hypothetical protein
LCACSDDAQPAWLIETERAVKFDWGNNAKGLLCTVVNSGNTLLPGAMSAAVDLPALLDAMADNSAITMRAGRCHRVNSAFEAVEGHRSTILSNSEGLIIFIAAMIAFSHFHIPLIVRFERC